MDEKVDIAEEIIATEKVSVVVEDTEPKTVVETDVKNVSEDYDSGDSYSDERVDRRSDKGDSDTEGSVILEREEGDGQESLPAKKVDDDEDKKNPQYIPKRGTFYEHDDRTADDNETEVVEEKEKEGKKKIWTDKKEKWGHDKFNDNEQAPKSRAELIAIYGYDIRNEEGPPRARRRRRYGRGPNKYTRNWEDEDAYNKPPLAVKKPNSKKPNKNEIEKQNNINAEDGGYSGRPSSENERMLNEPQLRPIPTQEHFPKLNGPSDKQNIKNQQRAGMGRVSKPPSREIKDSDYRGFTKPRHFPPNTQVRDRDPVQSLSFTNKRNQENLEREMGKMSLQEQHGYNTKLGGQLLQKQQHGNTRQASVPPRMQSEQKGSKRYSSIRQRSLPESVTPPFNQPHSYYPNEYNQQGQVNSNQQPPPQMLQHQSAPQILPNPAQMPSIPPPPLPSLPQQVPVTSTPLPPQFSAAFPQPPPAFLQPAPPSFLPQQPAPILNYVQGQQFAPPQAPYQGYQQSFQPVAVSQPTEIFQPPGGITYYSAHDQQAAQRAALQKRPKAAIPIVPPPPPLEPRGRGRSLNPEAPLHPNEASVENIETSNHYEDVAVQQ